MNAYFVLLLTVVSLEYLVVLVSVSFNFMSTLNYNHALNSVSFLDIVVNKWGIGIMNYDPISKRLRVSLHVLLETQYVSHHVQILRH